MSLSSKCAVTDAVVSYTLVPCTANEATLAQQPDVALKSPRESFLPVTGAMATAAMPQWEALPVPRFSMTLKNFIQIIATFVQP